MLSIAVNVVEGILELDDEKLKSEQLISSVFWSEHNVFFHKP